MDTRELTSTDSAVSVPAPGPTSVRSIALTVLAVIALGAVAYVGRPILAPLAFGVILSLLLAPAVRLLGQAHISPPFAAGLTLLSCIGLTGYGAWVLSEPAANWLQELPKSLRQVTERLEDMRGSLDTVNKAAEQVERITAPEESARSSVQVDSRVGTAGSRLLFNAWSLLGSTLIAVVLAFFLLSDADSFLRSIVKVLPKLEDKKRAVTVVREIESQISRYLVTITTINLALGAAVGLCMYLAGMPTPILWGVMAAIANFVPYVGAFAGTCVIGVVSFLTFHSLGATLLPPVLYVAATSIEGTVLTPSILGRRFLLRPAIVFAWLIVCGALWGIAGALLSVPLLVMTKILCDNVQPLAPMSEFLARDANRLAWRARRGDDAEDPPSSGGESELDTGTCT